MFGDMTIKEIHGICKQFNCPNCPLYNRERHFCLFEYLIYFEFSAAPRDWETEAFDLQPSAELNLGVNECHIQPA